MSCTGMGLNILYMDINLWFCESLVFTYKTRRAHVVGTFDISMTDKSYFQSLKNPRNIIFFDVFRLKKFTQLHMCFFFPDRGDANSEYASASARLPSFLYFQLGAGFSAPRWNLNAHNILDPKETFLSISRP